MERNVKTSEAWKCQSCGHEHEVSKGKRIITTTNGEVFVLPVLDDEIDMAIDRYLIKGCDDD